jgi:glutamate-1-semialdehyde 2,1-aminomutase
VVLIFDEIITGFRLRLGGAQEYFGVTPDLAVFGKALASGFPISCVAGRGELFDLVEANRVIHAGTFNGSPISTAAALATLKYLRSNAAELYDGLERRGRLLMNGLARIPNGDQAAYVVQGKPALFGIAFTGKKPTNHYDMLDGHRESLKGFLPYVVAEGVRISWRGNFFPSMVHSDQDTIDTLERFERAWLTFAEQQS